MMDETSGWSRRLPSMIKVGICIKSFLRYQIKFVRYILKCLFGVIMDNIDAMKIEIGNYRQNASETTTFYIQNVNLNLQVGQYKCYRLFA